MQSWKTRRMMVRFFAVMAALVFSLVLLGCSDDDDDGGGGGTVDVQTGAVPLSATNASTLNDITFQFANGGFLDAGLNGFPIELTFQDIAAGRGLVTLEGRGFTAEGDVTVSAGTVTITWLRSTFPPGQGPQARGTSRITEGSIRISANDVPVGNTDGVDGTLLLRLASLLGVGTAEADVLVSVDEQGNLFVNGNLTDIDIDITGISGSGN